MAGWLEQLVSDAEAIAAISEPPADTRAYFRGRCIDTFPEQVVAANWDSLVFDVGSDALRQVPMMEPMRGPVPMWVPCSTSAKALPSCSGGSGPDRATRETSWPNVSRSASQPPTSARTRRPTPVGVERSEELKAELDDLLDEIDEVLETNAEDFVKSYIQKGGQ